MLNLCLQIIGLMYYIRLIPWIISRDTRILWHIISPYVAKLTCWLLDTPDYRPAILYVITFSMLENNLIFHFYLLLLYDVTVKETMVVEDKLYLNILPLFATKNKWLWCGISKNNRMINHRLQNNQSVY